MTTDVRVLEPGDWDHWYGRLERAFGGVTEPPDERELWRKLTECERSLAIWDAGEVVGTAGAFSFRVTVPGGAAVPAAGVTMVSVQPTHRRRGLLTAMMRRQLDDVHALGEPLAVLTASEPAIYGRFGFGIAAWGDSIEVAGAQHVTIAGAGDAVEYIDEARAREVLPAIYARATTQRPGALRRGDVWWRERRFIEAPYMRKGASRRRHVLAMRDGAPIKEPPYRVC